MAAADEPCRVCYNALDATDRGLQACKCGFQVCLFCYHKIKETGNGQCPGCREEYGDKPIRFDVSKEALEKERVSKRKQAKSKRTTVPRDGLSEEEKAQWAAATATAERHRQELLERAGRGRSDSGAAPASTGTASVLKRSASAPEPSTSSTARPKSATPHPGQTLALTRLASRSAAEREELRDARVIQRNLVYVTGLAPQYARSETLSRPEYFGRYGEVVKVVVNKQNLAASNGRPPSASAYITFRTEEQAATAVRSVTGYRLDSRVLKASFGTNKYCATFLRGTPCVNADCMYLHLLGSSGDSFSKEQMSDARFIALTTPTAGGSALAAAAEQDAAAAAAAAAPAAAAAAAAGAGGTDGSVAAGGARQAGSAGPRQAGSAGPRQAGSADGAARALLPPRHRAPHKRQSLATLNSIAGVMEADTGSVRAFKPSDSVRSTRALTLDLLVPGVKPDPSPEPLPGLAGRIIHQWPSFASPWVMAHDSVCATFVLTGAAAPKAQPSAQSLRAATLVARAIAPDTDDGATALASGSAGGPIVSDATIASLAALERIASGIVTQLTALRPDGQLPSLPMDSAAPLPGQMRVASSLSNALIPGRPATEADDDDDDDDDDAPGKSSAAARGGSARYASGRANDDEDNDEDDDDDAGASVQTGSEAPSGGADGASDSGTAAGGSGPYEDEDGGRAGAGGSRRKQRHRKRGGNRRRGAQTVTK